MPVTPYQIAEVTPPLAYRGLIGLSLCPGRKGRGLSGEVHKRDLHADLDVVGEWGAWVVLTLMEGHELDAAKIAKSTLTKAVEDHSMQWMHMPIVDVGIPKPRMTVEWQHTVAPALKAILYHGGRVFIHCRGGLGRAGMIASRLLVECGDTPVVAMRKVRAVRPGAIETETQERWVRGK